MVVKKARYGSSLGECWRVGRVWFKITVVAQWQCSINHVFILS